MCRLRFAYILATLLVFSVAASTGRLAEADVRETAAVLATEQAYPCVAAVYVQREGRLISGSGSVIDPRGYVLTAAHLGNGAIVVLLPDRPPLIARLIASLPERDLAILKVGAPLWPDRPAARNDKFAGKPIPCLSLGFTEETRLAETVLNVGNPGGRGVVVTRGILSSTGQVMMNALGLRQRRNDPTDRLVQFDAASNKGNSGGALIDLRGRLIGISTGGITNEVGTNYAVPIDTFREQLYEMLHAGRRFRYRTGLTTSWKTELPVVESVAAESPAAVAGLQPGDVIVSADEQAQLSAVTFEFSKLDWRAGQDILLTINRSGQEQALTMTPAPRNPLPSFDVVDPIPGLLCRAAPFRATDDIPDPLFDDPPDTDPIVVNELTPAPENRPAEDGYELSFSGFIKVPTDGLYRLELESDDGSRLFLHDQPVIENGENHPARTRTTWQLLARGLHPVRVDYFEDTGDEMLELRLGRGLAEATPVSADSLFHASSQDVTESE